MSVDDLQLGSSYPGKVVSVVPFGAFVDIGDSSARLARFERREAKPICLLPSFTAPRREPTSIFLNAGALLYLQSAGCGTDGLLHVSELSDDFVSDVDR